MLTEGALFAGRYRIIRLLGEGGFGAVFEAEHTATGRRLALKTLLPSVAAKPRERERFLQEARVGSRIASAHVVSVEDAGIDEPTATPWLSMELLSGQHLGDLLATHGPLPLAEVQHLFAQLGDALGAAHDAGVIHRDLKPENLFVADARQHGVATVLKVLDFGIAQILREGATSATVTTGIGSPLWMAPEQAMKGSRVSPATDVWSLGLLAYFALTGRYYWRNAERPDVDTAALLMEVVAAPLSDVLERARVQGCEKNLPVGFEGWFGRCVQRDVRQRFADGRAATVAFGELRMQEEWVVGRTGLAPTQEVPPGWVARAPLGASDHAASKATQAVPDLDGVMAHDGGKVFGPLLRAVDEAERRSDHDAVIRGGEQLLSMAPGLPGLRARLARAYEGRAGGHASAGRGELAALDRRRAGELATEG